MIVPVLYRRCSRWGIFASFYSPEGEHRQEVEHRPDLRPERPHFYKFLLFHVHIKLLAKSYTSYAWHP